MNCLTAVPKLTLTFIPKTSVDDSLAALSGEEEIDTGEEEDDGDED